MTKQGVRHKIMTPKRTSTHPPFVVMVQEAIIAGKERFGSSRPAILKYILANYRFIEEPTKVQARVKKVLRQMIDEQKIVPGGAVGKKGAGRFKLPSKVKKATVKVMKKPAVKKAKSSKSAVKITGKPTAKKSGKPAGKKTLKPADKKTVLPADKKTVLPAKKKTVSAKKTVDA